MDAVLGIEVEIEQRELFAAPGRDRNTVGGVTCCVPGCFNNTFEDARKVSFHKFPDDTHQRRLWVNRGALIGALRSTAGYVAITLLVLEEAKPTLTLRCSL